MMYYRILFKPKQFGRLALLGVVMAMSACGGGDSAGTASSPTTGPTAVLGANEVAPVSGQTVVVGPETGGVVFAPGDAAQNSIPTLTRVKNLDLSTLFDAEKSTLMTEGAADYEILIKFPLFPTGDSTITVTVPDALASKVTDSNAVVAYVVNGDISEPSPFDPVASTYDPSTKKLAFVLPKDYLSESATGSGSAGEVTVKIGLAKTFNPEATTTGTQTKSVGTSAFQTTVASQKLPCPVDGSNGCIETSRFGPRIGGVSPMHRAVDFRAVKPTPLLAVVDGVVRIPEGLRGTVDIISGQAIYRYMHLSQTDVTNGQKVKAKDVIGLSGNIGPTTGTVAYHLHFVMWQPVALANIGVKAKWVVAKVDPFPYFVDKISVDIPGNKTPGDTTVTDKFALELKGYDIDGRPVTTAINNNTNFIEKMRPVKWSATLGTALHQEKFENSYHKILGSYKKGLDPSRRNIADIVMPSSEVAATITAVWEGVSPEAKYSLEPFDPAGFYVGTYTGCNSFNCVINGAFSMTISKDGAVSVVIPTSKTNAQEVGDLNGLTFSSVRSGWPEVSGPCGFISWSGSVKPSTAPTTAQVNGNWSTLRGNFGCSGTFVADRQP